MKAPSSPNGIRSPSGPSAIVDAEELAMRFGDATHALLSLGVGAILWEFLARLLRFSFFPPLSNIVRAALGLVASGQVVGNLLRSLFALTVGYGLAACLGVTLGMLMGRYDWLDYMVGPYIHALLAAPMLVYVPLVYAFFGLGRGTQVAVVFLSSFFAIVVSARAGIRNVNPAYLQMARAFGATERQLFWKVLLPGSLPLTMAGLRLGMGRAVRGMINGEMFVAVFGLGALLRTYGSRFDSTRVFAVLMVVVAVALVCSALMTLVERRATSWMGNHRWTTR